MSETKETPDKAPAAGARKPLSLKRTESSGHVQQSFSHGRKNVVVVERKKRRTITGPGQEDEPRGRAGGTAAPAAGGRHPGAEAMPALAHELARLIGPFHKSTPRTDIE